MFSSSLQSWLSHEVEVLVSVGQARQTLESLIEDRKALSRQLAELRTQEQDEDDEPATKVLSVCLFATASLHGVSMFLQTLFVRFHQNFIVLSIRLAITPFV